MESKVVKNLAVDAKLVVHLPPPTCGDVPPAELLHRPIKQPFRFWVTLRSQEGSHETSFSYPENYTFSKPNRTFPSPFWSTARSRVEANGEIHTFVDGVPLPSANPATSETRRCRDCRRSATAASYSTHPPKLGTVLSADGVPLPPPNPTTSEAWSCLDRGWGATPAAYPAQPQKLFWAA